jgi:hypothetical protein
VGEDTLIFAVLTTGAVLIINQVARLVRNQSMQKTIREAISRDSGAVADLIARIDEASPAAKGHGDDRIGLILIALAAALALYSVIVGDPEDIRQMGGMALFPGLVGAVLLGREVWLKRRGAAR